ncbi:hypothetical protein, conserved [Eimeria maxima]|uniref:Uncharacterized protein n=1 Tax=Eimeria maxima TaxID=5804 RepID=U6MDN3_EIMMA|nr:hypothetical protein, conserved [Eimeria maxima]CDJ61168.1 hypothetical protein, conserved [Eimeria maxima]
MAHTLASSLQKEGLADVEASESGSSKIPREFIGAEQSLKQKLRILEAKHMQLVRLAASYRNRNEQLLRAAEQATQRIKEVNRTSRRENKSFKSLLLRTHDGVMLAMWMTQLEALDATRLQDANAAHEEIAASEKEKQGLQNQLEEAQQLLRQQQAEIRTLKAKAPQNTAQSSSICRGAKIQSYTDTTHQGDKPGTRDDANELADCSRLRMAIRSKDRQLRTLQGELTELKQQHIQVQQQSEKQQQELLKLAQRLEVLRKSKGHFEAKATRTALALEAAYMQLRTEREEKASLLRLACPPHLDNGAKVATKAHWQPLREGAPPEDSLKPVSEIIVQQDDMEQKAVNLIPSRLHRIPRSGRRRIAERRPQGGSADQGTNLLPSANNTWSGQNADSRPTHKSLYSSSKESFDVGSATNARTLHAHYRKERLCRALTPIERGNTPKCHVSAQPQTRSSCYANNKCTIRGKSQEQEQGQLLDHTLRFPSHNPCNSRHHETQGGISTAHTDARELEHMSCEQAFEYSVSEASANEGFLGKLNCRGDEDKRPAAVAQTQNSAGSWEAAANGPTSNCSSGSTYVGSETAENIVRSSYSNSSLLRGPHAHPHECGHFVIHHGGPFHKAQGAMHTNSTSSAQHTGGNGSCGLFGQHRAKGSLSGELTQTHGKPLSMSWHAAQHGGAAAPSARDSCCSIYNRLHASHNLPNQYNTNTAGRPVRKCLGPCARELSPSWGEYEGCGTSHGNEDGISVQIECSQGGPEGPEETEGSEAPIRKLLPGECAVWSQLSDSHSPCKTCGHAQEHSEHPTVSTATASGSSQLPITSSPLRGPQPSCSCSPVSDTCGGSAIGRPGPPVSDGSIQLSVSEESPCVTPQPHPTSCSVNKSHPEPATRECGGIGLRPRKARPPGDPVGGSSRCAGTRGMDLGAFGFLPSLPVLNIAARIIQRHWKKARCFRRQPSRVLAFQKASPTKVETIQNQHSVRSLRPTWELYPELIQRPAAAPRRKEHQGQPQAPGPVVPEPDASMNSSIQNPRTGVTAIEACPAASSVVTETLRGEEQPRFGSEGTEELGCPLKETLDNSEREGPPAAHLTSSRCPQASEAIEQPGLAHAGGRLGLLPHEGVSTSKTPGDPEDGSASSDAEFAALLEEAEAYDRSDSRKKEASSGPEGCASFPGSPNPSFLKDSALSQGAHIGGGIGPRAAPASSNNGAVSCQLHAGFLEGHEVLSVRDIAAFAGEGEIPTPETTRPVFIDQTHKIHQSHSSCCTPVGPASVEHCSLPLHAVYNPHMMLANHLAATFISRPNAEASCLAAVSQQHGNPNSRPAHETAAASCTSKEAPLQPRGRPPIPPKDLIAAGEQVTLQQRLAENAQDFRKQLMLQMQRNESQHTQQS